MNVFEMLYCGMNIKRNVVKKSFYSSKLAIQLSLNSHLIL